MLQHQIIDWFTVYTVTHTHTHVRIRCIFIHIYIYEYIKYMIYIHTYTDLFASLLDAPWSSYCAWSLRFTAIEIWFQKFVTGRNDHPRNGYLNCQIQALKTWHCLQRKMHSLSGVYTVRKAPHEWPNMAALLDNNFRNMLARDAESHGVEAARKETTQQVGWIFVWCFSSESFQTTKKLHILKVFMCLESQPSRSTLAELHIVFPSWPSNPVSMMCPWRKLRRWNNRPKVVVLLGQKWCYLFPSMTEWHLFSVKTIHYRLRWETWMSRATNHLFSRWNMLDTLDNHIRCTDAPWFLEAAKMKIKEMGQRKHPRAVINPSRSGQTSWNVRQLSVFPWKLIKI